MFLLGENYGFTFSSCLINCTNSAFLCKWDERWWVAMWLLFHVVAKKEDTNWGKGVSVSHKKNFGATSLVVLIKDVFRVGAERFCGPKWGKPKVTIAPNNICASCPQCASVHPFCQGHAFSGSCQIKITKTGRGSWGRDWGYSLSGGVI